MTGRQSGILEVAAGIADHPDALHQPARASVARHGEGYDLIQTEPLEAESQCRAGGLGRVPAAPVLVGQPPSDLHAWSESRFEPNPRKPDEAGERGHTGELEGSQSEAVVGEMRLDAIGQCVAVRSGQDAGKMFHHPRIGVQLGKQLAVGRQPTPQAQALGSKLERQVHRIESALAVAV